MIETILAVIVGVHLFAEIILVAAYLLQFRDEEGAINESTYLPSVSILIAARNEEENIERCLQSLISQDYPVQRMEILIGDDDSTDSTFAIAQKYSESHDFIQVVKTKRPTELCIAKANVLSQLSAVASGEQLLITDADMELPAAWVKAMIATSNNADIAFGITTTKRSSLWSELQGLEWLLALCRIKILADMGWPITAIGNNMRISMDAYKAIGGFESLGPTVTEDFDLLRAAHRQGFKARFLFGPDVLGNTIAKSDFAELLAQRRRWLTAVFRSNIIIVLLLIVQTLFWPTVLLLIWASPLSALVAAVAKLLLHSMLMYVLSSTLQVRPSLIASPVFHLYQFGLYLTSLINYVLPTKIEWKGRHY